MKLFKRLKNKDGFVMETAILFMAALFSFCLLLSTLTVIGHKYTQIEKTKLERDAALDRILDEYLIFVSGVQVPVETTANNPESETAAPAQSENQTPQVDAEPADIEYEYPLLSPLDAEVGENNGENNEAEPQPGAEPETTKDPIPYFWDTVKDNAGERYTFLLASGYLCMDKHIYDASSKTVIFELYVTRGEGTVMYVKISKMHNGPTHVLQKIIY